MQIAPQNNKGENDGKSGNELRSTASHKFCIYAMRIKQKAI